MKVGDDTKFMLAVCWLVSILWFATMLFRLGDYACEWLGIRGAMIYALFCMLIAARIFASICRECSRIVDKDGE